MTVCRSECRSLGLRLPKKWCFRPRRLLRTVYPQITQIQLYNLCNLWIISLWKEPIMEPVATVLAFLFFGFIGIVLLVIAAKTIRIVPQATVMLVERLGRFDKVASSGLNLLVPFLDRPRAVYWTNMRPGVTSIDLREQYLDLPPQPVITRDNVTIHVDSVVYWQITDPVKAVYEVADLIGAIVQLTITGMRAVIDRKSVV